MWHSFEDRGTRVEVDLATQRLSIDVPREGVDWERAWLRPVIEHDRQWGMVSIAALAQKAKQFDDGLYAAVELAAQDGKAGWLVELARRTQSTVLGTAARLGGFGDVAPIDDRALAEFLGNEGRSRPIGFYTWSERLQQIFQQDRWLQRDLEPTDAAALHAALDGAPELGAQYDRYLALVEKLTNPFVGSSVRGSAAPIRWCPPSRAHETDIVKQLFGDREIPDDFRLDNELIARITDGRLALTPTAMSGWYDYQTWALEPLVTPDRMPEAQRLRFGPRYKPLLLELFRGLLALTRETHIKQAEEPLCGAGFREPPIQIRPIVSAEPMPTYFLRRAIGYRFIWRVLAEYFGDALWTMHRVTAGGPKRAESLGDELRDIEALFYGAHAATSTELGLLPDGGLGYDDARARAALERFRAWDPAQDRDIGVDSRMVVPIYYDIVRKKRRCWAFLGWVQQPVTIAFQQQPVYRCKKAVEFQPRYAQLYYPMIAEVYCNKLYNRDEFRQACDELQTRDKIVRWLEA